MPRFLVVDDDPAAARAMSQLLRQDGHEVVTHTAGADAVDALPDGAFDAVLTDLEMPHVDGHAVVKAAREHQPHACLVVATVRANDEYHRLVDAGACIVADKPFEYDEITHEVHACRARGGPGAHGRCHMRSRPHGHQVVPQRRK